MKALTHRDLKKGLPEEVQHWVADERSEMMTGYRLDHRLARILVENDPSIIGTDTDI